MEFRPILSSLRRHKTAAALIVLEVALTCAIVCNAIFLIGQRVERMQMPSGVAENELLRIQAISARTRTGGRAMIEEDLAALRAVPGVTHAAAGNQLPFGNSSNNSGVRLSPEQDSSTLNAAVYSGSEDLVETLGLRLVAGRGFAPDEFVDAEALERDERLGVPAAILNRRMAERLFPGEDAVGKVFYSWGEAPIRVVGVVEELVRPNSFGLGQYAMVLPVRYNQAGVNYLIRTEPGRRAEVLAASLEALNRIDPNRVVANADVFTDLRERFFAQDRAMAWLLTVVIAALLVVTALGIVGLASFWVQQRNKQIGIRRALGATRGQILRYFQAENFLLAGIGIALGMLLAYGLNQWLMARYEIPRLPLSYLPAGAIALWLLGQIAVYWPARRAAAVPPAVATRSA
ncbi:ABC transporter permease [Luteimonas huabeiensis]|uniref:ABC transporter permease n=1 Tax=Luteimonas huabeiensis TaxID=1244513 RepID=UPI0004644FD0|nr:FtsX-like permease family protein [Luteimonas huabeiensis]